MTRSLLLMALLASLGLPPAPAVAQSARRSVKLPPAGLDLDPTIPSIKKSTGRGWGEDILNHQEVQSYLRALAAAAPDRSKLVRYGESYQRRGLHYLVITSAKNLRRLERIRKDNLRLADARKTNGDAAARLAAKTPAIVWLAYSVHGNEISCTDAALLTAYHLLADRGDQTRKWLEETVVIIDPLQNPDGRERFVDAFRDHRGAFIDPEPLSREHTERWPGGRSNHYWFDMNRDWFLQSQKETRAKVAAYLDWRPQIYVDAHEMGRDNTYYFAPPTDPINPFLSKTQHQWLFKLGKHHAARFDERGFRYTTREIFDAFYPGYGSEWPTLQGGLGVLWEQASSRGLVVRRGDESLLFFGDGVLRHYTSGLATIQFAARNRRELQSSYLRVAKEALELGGEGPVRHYFLLEADRPARAARLARMLRRNGIEVFRLVKPTTARGESITTGEKIEQTAPAGSYHIPVKQPTARLIRVLLDRNVPMDEAFVKQQLERNALYLPDQIYDVTAWSLPMAFGVPCLASADVETESEKFDGAFSVTDFPPEPPKVAYLAPPSDAALRAAAWWLRRGLRLHVIDRKFRLGGRSFAPGTLLLLKSENGRRDFPQLVKAGAKQAAAEVVAADTGFVDEGAHFGGPHVKWIRPPRPLLVVDRPTRYATGHTWHLFDQVLRYPVTRVAGRDLPAVVPTRYNVLILPDGEYKDHRSFGAEQAQRWKDWVRGGGTLILFRGAARWAADEEIGLIPSELVRKKLEVEKPAEKKIDSATPKPPKLLAPDRSAGAFFRATAFQPHWVTFGVDQKPNVFFTGNVIFKSLLPTDGRNLVAFHRDPEKILASGFCWPTTRKLLAGTPYVLYQAEGKGHIVAFTDDPNFRAMYPAMQRLFVNTVLFGPGH